jgi:ATP-dependent RNA helicase RhlE
MGYTETTPIQAQAIPVVLSGKDVMGAAQTGTGKTAAFALPLLQRLLVHQNSSASPARHPIRALVLLPTRELADQVAQAITQYAAHTQLRTLVVFGGMDLKPQALALRQGVEILVATPGRLLDHLEAKHCSLSQVEYVVLDEADRMLDIGFLPDLERIVALLPKKRTTLLFSATFSPSIKRLAESYLQNPVLVEVSRPNATAKNVTQRFYKVDNAHKQSALLQLLKEAKDLTHPTGARTSSAEGNLGLAEENPSVADSAKETSTGQAIVFVNSKLGCARLARCLEKEGLKASALHGDKSQEERLKALAAFKAGDIEVLVATDVAARGLDIADLPVVVNFDIPWNAEDYVHRIGRTGRAGASGVALTLVSGDDSKALAEIGKLTQQSIALLSLETGAPVPEGSLAADKKAVSPRASSSASKPSRRRAAPAVPEDPLFTQGYEPAPRTDSPAWEPTPSNNPRPTRSSNIKAKRSVAALFANKPKGSPKEEG